MDIVQPQAIIETPLDASEFYTRIERFGRTAYKSEAKISLNSAVPFVQKLIASGHESVLEHVSISVRFVCDRGVSHELVRHRIAAFTQESTRYVNYAKRGMEVIRPCFWMDRPDLFSWWEVAMEQAEASYNLLLKGGATPQQARSVLPNSLKTEIVATMNVRQWRYVLRLRTAPGNHPQMRQLMFLLLDKLEDRLPVLFGDIRAHKES